MIGVALYHGYMFDMADPEDEERLGAVLDAFAAEGESDEVEAKHPSRGSDN